MQRSSPSQPEQVRGQQHVVLVADRDREPARRDLRREGLREVDYGPFPRLTLKGGMRPGLMLNESEGGLCLLVAQREEVGSLLRVAVTGLHGHTSREVISRVAWCAASDHSSENSSENSGAFRLGLELLRESQSPMLRVRRERGEGQRSIRG